MPTRPIILIFFLILLAALAAALIIALLSALPGPPAPAPTPSPAPAEAPSPAPAEPKPGITITIIADKIVDSQTGQELEADVYINGALLYEKVRSFQVTLPLDGSAHIRVTAPGYQP